LLQNADFTTARDIADAINKKLGKNAADAVDSRRVDVNVSAASAGSVPNLIALIQNLGVETHVPAKVIVNERTGTIVMGGNVRLAPVSVIHGSLTIDVQTIPIVSQPYPDSNGTTRVVPETKLTTTDAPAQSIQLQAGANVDELIRGLHAIGATSRDVVSILQAIKEAGGLEAELEVI
jgi:flagellar P-ring protein precursor FlgI